MMSSLTRGLCLAALIMAVGVMAGSLDEGEDGPSDLEIDNMDAPLAGDEGENAVEPTEDEDVDGELPDVDDSQALFTNEDYEAADEDGQQQKEADAEKAMQYLHEAASRYGVALPKAPKGKAAHDAAATLHPAIQHAALNAAKHKEANPKQKKMQAKHKANVKAKVRKHELNGLRAHLKGQKPASGPSKPPHHKNPSAHNGATSPHPKNDKKKPAAGGHPKPSQ
jgi:hypothetical protein